MLAVKPGVLILLLALIALAAWFFLKGKAPFAVGDRVFLIATPGFGLGTVLQLTKVADGTWWVTVQWDATAQAQTLPASMLAKN